jgi:uncharacterized membrane protein YccC
MLQTILDHVWAFANSALGISVIASAVLFWLNKLYAAKPAWKKYEGTIVSAIRSAEKAIPDNVDNAGARRFDAALKYALLIMEATEKRRATEAETASLREGIHLVHSSLEAQGALDGPELDNG